MDTLLIVIGILVLVTGMIGSILPILPGPWLSYLSLIALQITSKHPFTANFLILVAVLVTIISVLDYVVPIWSTKKLGGSKSGVRGSTIGLFAGLFLGPFGMIIGPFIGAIIGELLIGKEFHNALKIGFATFLGFITGVIMKVGLVGFIAFYFIKHAFFV